MQLNKLQFSEAYEDLESGEDYSSLLNLRKKSDFRRYEKNFLVKHGDSRIGRSLKELELAIESF